MPIIIILVGIPGSGKSTVLHEAVKILPKLRVINYGDMMMEEASTRNIGKDQMRKLPFSEQQKIGVDAARKMAQNFKGVVCIDTHALVKTPFGFIPGIPEDVIRILKPRAIAMIETNSALIHERRKSDQTRDRDVESIPQIEYHMHISRSFCLACSATSGALFSPIWNENDPKQAAQQLAALIQSNTGDESHEKASQ